MKLEDYTHTALCMYQQINSKNSPHVRRIFLLWNPESGKFSTEKTYLESGTKSTAWNPESKTVLDALTFGGTTVLWLEIS